MHGEDPAFPARPDRPELVSEEDHCIPFDENFQENPARILKRIR
jgi:hypothetical protein